MGLTFSWLYGILAIASMFITAGMFRMGRDRLIERQKRNFYPKPDLYLMIIFYAGVHGMGGTIWWTVRAWDAVINREPNVGTASWFVVLLAAILYAVGKGGLVFSSAINGKPLIWRVFLLVCFLWSLLIWWQVFWG